MWMEGRLERTEKEKLKVIKVGQATRVPIGQVVGRRIDSDTGEVILKVMLYKSGEITEVSEEAWKRLTG